MSLYAIVLHSSLRLLQRRLPSPGYQMDLIPCYFLPVQAKASAQLLQLCDAFADVAQQEDSASAVTGPALLRHIATTRGLSGYVDRDVVLHAEALPPDERHRFIQEMLQATKAGADDREGVMSNLRAILLHSEVYTDYMATVAIYFEALQN